ncbi:KamA family radical SAM protein [bacterium]|nr:KamA family radical SAM protein [bacterium]
MDIYRIRKKLHDVLNLAPGLKKILLAREPLDVKRRKMRSFLSRLLTATFEDNPTIPSLEWIMTRDAISVLRGILSERSERLSGFSFIQYLDRLLLSDDLESYEKPAKGFYAELEHLLRGIMGKTDVYKERVPAFFRYKGAKAAKLRSEDLSRMARQAKHFMDRYPCGLDGDALRRRRRNRERILEHLGGTEEDWGNWKWHTRNIIRDVDTLGNLIDLSDEEREAVRLSREYRIAFGITPYYLSLMDRKASDGRDRAVRAQVIPTLHYVKALKKSRDCEESSMDFMLERNTSPIEGITRRYPMIVILKPFMTCPQICVYCQRNWEIEDVHSSHAVLSREKLDRALSWIAKTPEISEVLVTGGDPLLLSDSRLEHILSRLAQMRHVERIRIGTRTPVTLPQRITDSLVQTINRFHHPGRREVLIVTHFEHPYELTPAAVKAVQAFRKSGIEVCNQLVYTFFNSRKFEAAVLRHRLRLAGVAPYYTFNTKGKEETDDYRVPIARLLQEQKEEARLLPGTVRTDEIVFNVPGLGKNYLRAVQHHDIISILPSGRRVYEFHPWEKKLALVDTYVYTDVSIYDYLKRLQKAGENIGNYKTIWYYF